MTHDMKTIFNGSETVSIYETLKKEYDSIKNDIHTITEMEISDEAKKLPLKELQEQIDDVKKRMEDYAWYDVDLPDEEIEKMIKLAESK